RRSPRVGARARRPANRPAPRRAAAATRCARIRSRLAAPPARQEAVRLESLAARLARAGAQLLADRTRRAETLAAQLELVSPEAVLERGYAIVRRPDGRVVRAAAEAPDGTLLSIRLAHDELRARAETDPKP